MKEAPIICLASWYPNEIDRFEGDFIQRKLQALSLYRRITVFNIKKHNSPEFEKERTKNTHGHLEEMVVYTKQGGTGIFSSLKNYRLLFKKHNAFLKNHIKAYGKPKAILVQVPYNAGIIAWYWKKRYGIDYILTEHYGIYNEQYEKNFSTRTSLYKFVVKQILRNATKLITVSHSLGRDIKNIGVEKEFSKLSNVVNTELFTHKSKPAPTPFTFCHLSNMIPVKNIPGMLKAAKILTDKGVKFKLNLIGGNNKNHQDWAEELSLKDKYVFFRDAISYEKVADVFQQSHALLMFSNTESQSCISLEALCTGTPVISSKAGGIEEHLDATNSILVDIKNEEALANAMMEIIENYDRYDQKTIAERNQALWNYKQIGKEYNDLIEDVLSL